MKCTWNKTWNKPLDECSWLSCPVVPEPPPSSNLLFMPANGSSLTLLSNYSIYGTTEDTFAVHPGFMKDRKFLVDGYIADDVNVTHPPSFELRDDLGRIAFMGVFDVRDQDITMTSDWNYGFPKTELVDIYPGEHFELEILFDTTNFEFQVKYNDYNVKYNVPTDNYWFANVSVWGDMYVQYAGFPFLGKSSFSEVYEIVIR